MASTAGETRRGGLLLLLFVGFVLTTGTLGYYLIEEGWSLIDAFYMTVITITTIGYGEVHELSARGRLFTVLLIIFGLGASAIFATHFARLLLESALKGVWGRSKMEKTIAKLSGHYVICGYAEIGRAICAELHESDIPFVVIDSSEEPVELAVQRQFAAVRGNATLDLTLLSAGITRAAGLVSTLSSDSDNLYISLTARELNPKLYIVVRSEGEGVERRMHRAGADSVVSPTKLGGLQIAQMIVEQAGGRKDSARGEVYGSVMGYHLRVYRNVTGGAVTVADALAESGAIRALSRQTVQGDLVDDPLPGDALEPGEALVMVFHERREQEREERPPAAASGESEWNEGLSVGVMAIDEEHQIILNLIGRLRTVSRSHEREAVSSALNEMVDYTVRHFRHEESLLRKHGYPDLEEHLRQHEELSRKVMALRGEKKYLVKENLSALLNEWIKSHILVTDKKYAPFLHSHGVR